jgi:hypothetical protein
MSATDKPSSWEVLEEYSKTVITLASALLAVSVTFSGNILSKDPNIVILGILYFIWFSLLFAIVLGLLVAGFIYRFLEAEETPPATPAEGNSGANDPKASMNEWKSRARTAANYAYLSLGVAAVLFVLLGIFTPRVSWDATQSFREARQVVSEIAKIPSTNLELQTLNFRKQENIYELQLMDTQTNKVYEIEIDAQDGKVLQVK